MMSPSPGKEKPSGQRGFSRAREVKAQVTSLAATNNAEFGIRFGALRLNS
jgi:hypothetical protein